MDAETYGRVWYGQQASQN